jgi:ATP-dependent helicase/nuclease subunit B
MSVIGADRTRILTVSDCDDEVRQAVRAVINAARTGTPLDRIAILHTSPEPYARLAHEQLSAAGITFNGASVMPLTARLAGRTLLQMLALPEGGFRREDVFAWLAGARLLAQGRFISVTAWERVSRDAEVVAGR